MPMLPTYTSIPWARLVAVAIFATAGTVTPVIYAQSGRLKPPEQAVLLNKEIANVRSTFVREIKEAARDEKLAEKLVNDLLSKVSATPDAEGKWALLIVAQDIAAKYSSDVETALKCIAVREKHFEIDGVQEQLAVLREFSEPKPPADASLFGKAMRMAEEVLSRKKYPEAREAVGIATAVGKALEKAEKDEARRIVRESRGRVKPPEAQAERNYILPAARLSSRISEAEMLFNANLAAREKLRGSPEDRDANAAVGEYQCFVEGAWAEGLPRLDGSKNRTLRTLAADEVRAQAAADKLQLLEAADNWWTAADNALKDSELRRDAARKHAAHLYQQVLSALVKPVDAKRASDRIREMGLTERHSHSHSPPPTGALTFCGSYAGDSGGHVWRFFPDGTLIIDNWGLGIWERKPDGSILVTRKLPTLAVEKDVFRIVSPTALHRDGDKKPIRRRESRQVVFGAINLPKHFVKADGQKVIVGQGACRDAIFSVVPGLADATKNSIESATRPRHYLKVENGAGSPVVLSSDDGTQGFEDNATFLSQVGLADRSCQSFCLPSSPDRFIRHAGFKLWVSNDNSESFRADATFRVTAADQVPEWVVYLSDLQELESKVTHLGFQKGVLNDKPMRSRADGTLSPHGLAMHPGDGPNDQCFVKYLLPCGVTRFSAVATLNESGTYEHCGIGFEVIADGKSVWTSKEICKTQKADNCDVDIRGCRNLELRTFKTKAAWGGHAIWVEPRVVIDATQVR